MNEVIKAHKFFCRKSQHYIIGDWNHYQPWWKDPNRFRDFNWAKFSYYKRFIPAYIKFMYLSIKDIIKFHNTQ